MKFEPLPLQGAYLIELEKSEDQRGFFARSFCEEEFAHQGLISRFPQCNLSYNAKKGTLRGLHYSDPAEIKLVRCIRGAAYDVLVDIRLNSPTYLRWIHVLITQENRKMVYIPEGFAHGYQTLENETELFYHMSSPYQPDSARRIRWDDPSIGVKWPIPHPILSPKDAA